MFKLVITIIIVGMIAYFLGKKLWVKFLTLLKDFMGANKK